MDLNSRYSHQHPNEVEVRGPNPRQGLSSSFIYNNDQPELPRQLDEQSNKEVDWSAFKDYLSKHYNRNTTKVRLCYVKRYYHVLLNEDASGLLAIESQQMRLNVMKSLTLLARFLGYYDHWQQMRKRYALKWTTGDESLAAMQRFFDDKLTLDSMLQKIKDMIRVLPKPMGLVIKHAVMTGLRPSETVESVRLLNEQASRKISCERYYNPEQQCLEHFRFPTIFLRRTKKAFISYITLDNLQPIANLGSKTPTWNAIRLTCRRRKLNMDMRYCRKLHGSWLHQSGVSTEEIDFLHGRTSPSIFSRHYLTPSQDLKDRVLHALEKLQMQLQ